MNKAKILFEEEAKKFDDVIPLLIPFYKETYDILISAVPFKNSENIRILDLGCGTGTLAKRLKQNFPLSKITCLDFSANMLEVAKSKLNKYKDDIEFLAGDFNKISSEEKYDVIVSSFALHHISTDKEKIRTYKNIYRSLTNNGVFLTADIVLGAGDHIKDLYFEKWQNFMKKNFSEQIIKKGLVSKYQADDNPSPMIKHLNWLQNVGFNEVETIWKYFNFAVWGGRKLES